MNLNLLTLFAPPVQSPAASTGSSNVPSSSAPTGVNFGDIMFGQLLAAQLQNPRVTAPLQNAAADLAQVRQLGGQLKATIAQLLQNGVTLEQVMNQLAKTLGSNVLAQLKTQLGVNPDADTQATVNQLIAQALGPPANGPPQSAAQVAAALVDRLLQVVDILGGISGNAAGQQQDSLGTISDAKAGDNPAPNDTRTLLQTVLAALGPLVSNPSPQSANVTPSSNVANAATQNSSGSTATAASIPIPPPAPWVPTAVATGTNANAPTGADAHAIANAVANANANANAQANFTLAQSIAQSPSGPTVAANPVLTLVGTGADTVIGRILARAANVAANQAASQPQPTPADGTALLQPQIAVAAASSASNGSTNDALLASVLRSLQTALASLPTPKPDSAAADSTTGGNVPTTSSVFASLGVGSLVTTATDPANASALYQTQAQPQTQGQIPLAYADPNGIVDQVLRGIQMRSLPDGTQSVRMRLVPESLGDVVVNLQVQNGSVNATLVAQNIDVRDALMANQQMLVRSLQDAGLKLASFNVNLANGGMQYQQPQNQSQPQFGTTRRYTGLGSDVTDEIVAAVPTFGPPQTQLAALQWLNALA